MFTVKGVVVEAIEVFLDHILVQEIESKSIYLIGFQDLEAEFDSLFETSNIVSLKGWKQWQEEKVENEKVKLQKVQINKRPQPPKPRPLLRLVTAR